jgi:hypothetical protein
MDETLNDNLSAAVQSQPQSDSADDEAGKLHAQYQSRLVAAGLRTEAVRAGMIDLDGLKLIDASTLVLDADDKIVGGRKLMEDLRREKPWLFGATFSSSTAAAPASQPVRQKTALEMTDEEYAAARAALIRPRF